MEPADRSYRLSNCGGTSGECPRCASTGDLCTFPSSVAQLCSSKYRRRIHNARCKTHPPLSHVVNLHYSLPRYLSLACGGFAILISGYVAQAGLFRPTMATPSLDQPSMNAQNIPQSSASVSQTESGHDNLASSAVEMKTLQSSADAHAITGTTTTHDSGAPQIAPVEFTNATEISSSESAQPLVTTSAPLAVRAELNRTETEAALGPSTDGPAANPDNANGPTVVIMLLLTTGAKHPYKIDGKYLKKRNVTVEDMNPYNISVYTLKELIWRDWREGTSWTALVHSFSPFV